MNVSRRRFLMLPAAMMQENNVTVQLHEVRIERLEARMKEYDELLVQLAKHFGFTRQLPQRGKGQV